MIDHKMEMKLTLERSADGLLITVEMDGAATEAELAKGLIELIDNCCQGDRQFREKLALALLRGASVSGTVKEKSGIVMDGKTYAALRKRGKV